MSTSIGDLKLSILLDAAQLSESIKTSLNLLRMFSVSAKDLLNLSPPSFNAGDFDAEIKKLNDSLDEHAKKIKETVSAEKQLDLAQQQSAVSSVRLSGILENASLRVQGFQSVLTILKSTFGNLISSYQEQEIANSKLLNNLKNVGEGIDAFQRLTNEASEFQKITVYGDEQIIDAQAMLGTFRKSSEEISILTPRLLDLAAAFDASGEGGKSLTEIAVMLGKVNEETIGTLRRVGVAFTKEQEEKLKSLKATEQTIYLAGILDSNFKGLAQTVGDTSAGQMKIFQNSVGEIKESLGQFLIENLLPLISSFKDLISSGSAMSDSLKAVTLGIMALAAAFVTLNTSMGAAPYVIIAIATAIGALSKAYGINTQKIQENKEEMLRNQQISESMKNTLDKLKISADNMAEAYKNISQSIIGMSKAQLESAEQFVNAEIAKIESLRETQKQLRMSELMKMDIHYLEAKKRSEQETNQFIEWSEYGANLDKLKELKSQIEAKKKFTPDDNKNPIRTTKSPETVIKEESDAVRELIDTWEKQINIYYTADQFKSKFKESGKSLIDVYKSVNDELKTNNNLTDEQLLNLIKFRDSVLDMMKDSGVSFKNLIAGGLSDEDPDELAKRFAKERMDWYNQYGSKDKRYKPLDEASEYVEALRLIKELRSESLTINDYQKFSITLKEKAATLDESSEKNARLKLMLLKEAKDYEEQITNIRKRALDAQFSASKLNIELIEDEFEKRRALVELEHQQQVSNLNELLNKARSESERSAIRQSLNALRAKKNLQLEQIDDDKQAQIKDNIFSVYESSIQSALRIYSIFGDSSDKIVQGFQKALEIVSIIKSVLDTISIIKSLASLLAAPFTGGASLAAMAFASGGIVPGSGSSDTVPALLTPGELVINKKRVQSLASAFGSGFLSWLNGGSLLSSSVSRYASGGLVSATALSAPIIREVPYIASTKLDGRDIQLVLRRINKYDNLSRL